MGVGVFLSLWVSLPLWLFFIILAAVALMPLLIKARTLWVWLLGVLFLCAGLLRGGAVFYPRYSYVPGRSSVELTGTLAELPSSYTTTHNQTGYMVKLVDASADGQPLSHGVSLYCTGPIDGKAGDTLSCVARLSFISEQRRVDTLARGIAYNANADECRVQSVPIQLKFIPARIAGHIKLAIDAMYGGQAPLVNGMLLGYKYDLDTDTRAAFAATGTSHILAVSGLHMGFIAAMAAFFTRKLRASLRFWLVVSFIWMYCMVVGMPASAVRACLMATCALAGDILGQKNDMLSSISAAALLILFISPAQLFTWGFQMSFAAVYGIVLFEQALSKFLKKRLPNAIGSSLSVSLSAQTGIAPVLLKIFGYVQPLSVFANLIVVPMAAIVTIGALLSVGLYMLSPSLSSPVSWVIQGVARAMRIVAELFSAIPFATVEVGFISAAGCTLLLILLFLLSTYFLPKGRERLPAIAAITALFLISVFA